MKHCFWIYSLAIMFAGTVFTTSAQQRGGNVADVDGNSYKTVIIGQQEWMAENLKVTKFNDGTEIPNVTAMDKWNRLTTPAFCWYDNDASNKDDFGALYNWFAVSTGNLCPSGWHIPTESEWDVLTDFLGGSDVAGGKLKQTGTSLWNSPNSGATNETGFSAVPGGYRYGQYWGKGTFYEKGINGYYWTGKECTETHSWSRTVHNSNTKVYRSFFTKTKGFSVRCIKDK